jgi:hypothetical protein
MSASTNNKTGLSQATYVLKLIIVILTAMILFGCLYALYFTDIKQYITVTGVTKTNRFEIPLIDETDIRYVKMVVPEETLDGIAKEISDKDYISDPNSPIQKEILLASSDYNYGVDMPWDRDVKACEVLKNTDQDLYADVQDSRHITIY